MTSPPDAAYCGIGRGKGTDPYLDPYQGLFYGVSVLLTFADPRFPCSYHVVQRAVAYWDASRRKQHHSCCQKRQGDHSHSARIHAVMCNLFLTAL
jgi:hypothetical protein